MGWGKETHSPLIYSCYVWRSLAIKFLEQFNAITGTWSKWVDGGSLFSICFFADVLLLLGEALSSQAKVIECILSLFCGESGQRINRAKSLVWFSPNTPNYLRCTICKCFEITTIANLGMYLGVPFIHRRVQKSTYQYIVDRVSRKLTSWKSQTLSKAGQLQLIRTFLSTIFMYSMQMAALPRGVITDVERISRGFF